MRRAERVEPVASGAGTLPRPRRALPALAAEEGR